MWPAGFRTPESFSELNASFWRYHITRGALDALRSESFVRRNIVRGAKVVLQPTPSDSAVSVRNLAPREGTQRVPAHSLVAQLEARGWAVLDGALPASLVADATAEAHRLLRAGHLLRMTAHYGALRTGAASSFGESPAWPALSSLLRRLNAAAARLPGPLGTDGTASLACYGAGERYNIHVDNEDGLARAGANEPLARVAAAARTAPVGSRRATLIVYLTDARWAPAREGELRLWPHGDVSDWARELRAREDARERGQPARNSGRAVDVEPVRGRLVLFNSSLPHEVRPVRHAAPGGAPRCALQVWALDPAWREN